MYFLINFVKKTMTRCLIISMLTLVMIGCVRNQVTMDNGNEGKMKNNIKMEEIATKIFHLDSCSAPRPTYMHYAGNDSCRELTFLNEYNASIYKYDYDSGDSIGMLKLPIDIKNIVNPRGYVFISDSVCGILDTSQMKLFIYDSYNNAILTEYDLKGDKKTTWPRFYPQYYPTTANPLMYENGKIKICGQSFTSLKNDNINKFKIETSIDLDTHSIIYQTEYPEEIYGNDANWEGGLQTSVYVTSLPDDTKLYSFPPSHDVLVAKRANYEWKYGGSNNAKTIRSIDKPLKKTTNKDMVENYICQDMYGPLLYDENRDLIYRYITYSLSTTKAKDNPLDKNVGIIVMDNELNYIGEVLLGSGHNWNVNNSFVTKEGLNIEYINSQDDEDILTLKIINFNKI